MNTNHILRFRNRLNQLNIIEKHNIWINVENEIIRIDINEKSDLSFLYTCIKHFINMNKFLPQSIYIIKRIKKNSKTKVKKSFNFMKSIKYWEFLDIMCNVQNEYTVSSETNDSLEITGWEIRYVFDIDTIENEVKIIEKGYEGLIKKIKNDKNDI